MQIHPLTLLYEFAPEYWVQDGLKVVHLLHQQSLAKAYGQLQGRGEVSVLLGNHLQTLTREVLLQPLGGLL